MKEVLSDPEKQLKQIILADMKQGDIIIIVTGRDEHAWNYEFAVAQEGKWPKGTLIATSPDGTVSPPLHFEMHGAGNWTSRQDNPVQTLERAFTSYFQHIYIGGNLVGRAVDEFDRMVFDKPGQEISEMYHIKGEE